MRWLRVPVLVILTTPLMLTMDEPGIDTPIDWAPAWHIIFLYAAYFGGGWIIYEHREIVAQLERCTDELIRSPEFGRKSCALSKLSTGASQGRHVDSQHVGGIGAARLLLCLLPHLCN